MEISPIEDSLKDSGYKTELRAVITDSEDSSSEEDVLFQRNEIKNSCLIL